MSEQPKLVVEDDPTALDKLLVLFWWWLPFFAFIPILSKRSSNYVHEHLMAVRCTFITLFAFLFLVPLARSFMLFSQTGDALGSFARTLPTFDTILREFFDIFGLGVERSANGVNLPLDLGILWFGAVLLNNFAISRGRFPYFLASSSFRPVAKLVGVGALVTAWLALTVSNVVAGEVGLTIDAVERSTLFIFFICMVVGYLLLERTNPFSETVLMAGSTLIAAGLLIPIMRIDLDSALPFGLGVFFLSVGLLALLFSRWRTRRNARIRADEKTA